MRVLGAILLAVVCGPALAGPLLKTPPLKSIGPAHPTAAAAAFSQSRPADCAVDPTEPTIIHLTPAKLETLRLVSREVNHTIKPVSDQDHWGVVDRWDFPDDGRGDCEDYQLLKRRRLEALGFPRRAMRMAVVLDEDRNGHAVLVVRTDYGDLILDNKTDVVVPWKLTGYEFVKGEAATTGAWETYAPPKPPTTSSQ